MKVNITEFYNDGCITNRKTGYAIWTNDHLFNYDYVMLDNAYGQIEQFRLLINDTENDDPDYNHLESNDQLIDLIVAAIKKSVLSIDSDNWHIHNKSESRIFKLDGKIYFDISVYNY